MTAPAPLALPLAIAGSAATATTMQCEARFEPLAPLEPRPPSLSLPARWSFGTGTCVWCGHATRCQHLYQYPYLIQWVHLQIDCLKCQWQCVMTRLRCGDQHARPTQKQKPLVMAWTKLEGWLLKALGMHQIRYLLQIPRNYRAWALVAWWHRAAPQHQPSAAARRARIHPSW